MSLLCTFFERDKNSNLKWVLFLSVDAQETSIKYGILKAWTHNHDRKTAYFSLQNCDPYISLNGKVSTLGFQAFQSNTFEKNQQTKTPPMTIERTIWRCLLGHCGVNWDWIRIYAMPEFKSQRRFSVGEQQYMLRFPLNSNIWIMNEWDYVIRWQTWNDIIGRCQQLNWIIPISLIVEAFAADAIFHHPLAVCDFHLGATSLRQAQTLCLFICVLLCVEIKLCRHFNSTSLRKLNKILS